MSRLSRRNVIPARPVAGALAALAITLICASDALAAARYRVRVGDTLGLIAARHHTSAKALAKLNRMKLGDTLFAGSLISLPAGCTTMPGDTAPAQTTATSTSTSTPSRTARLARYTVRPGDTLGDIASRVGWSVKALAKQNHLKVDGVLFAGATLRVPVVPVSRETLSRTVNVDVPASLDHWADHYGVDRRLVRALAWQESGYQPHVVSEAGAIGVMQVTPDTWDFVEEVLLRRSVATTADGNVRVGVAFLHHLLQLFGGDERRAVGAYYQGAKSVRDTGLLPETKQYVDNVLALKQRM